MGVPRILEGVGCGGRKFLFKAAGSSNGRTCASGAQYLGSSPSPAALNGNTRRNARVSGPSRAVLRQAQG